MLKTYVSICAVWLLSLAMPVLSQTVVDTTRTSTPRIRGVQYAQPDEALNDLLHHDDPLFAGVSISGDVCGAVMAAFCSYGQYEGAVRVNLKNRFFPIAEVGLGRSNYVNDESDNHFRVSAPYFRVGCDYNVLKDKFSGNRVFVGVRYGYTSFKYDMGGPAIQDPIWGTETPFHFTNISGNAHWGELVVGLETKVWKFFHLGWSARYRMRFSEKQAPMGRAWYLPGFGKNDNSAFGGTFNIIFDI